MYLPSIHPSIYRLPHPFPLPFLLSFLWCLFLTPLSVPSPFPFLYCSSVFLVLNNITKSITTFSYNLFLFIILLFIIFVLSYNFSMQKISSSFHPSIPLSLSASHILVHQIPVGSTCEALRLSFYYLSFILTVVLDHVGVNSLAIQQVGGV